MSPGPGIDDGMLSHPICCPQPWPPHVLWVHHPYPFLVCWCMENTVCGGGIWEGDSNFCWSTGSIVGGDSAKGWCEGVGHHGKLLLQLSNFLLLSLEFS